MKYFGRLGTMYLIEHLFLVNCVVVRCCCCCCDCPSSLYILRRLFFFFDKYLSIMCCDVVHCDWENVCQYICCLFPEWSGRQPKSCCLQKFLSKHIRTAFTHSRNINKYPSLVVFLRVFFLVRTFFLPFPLRIILMLANINSTPECG